ncbi:MAG: nicotinate (nicotinamide) nucleotide adenylyltransferase [Ruminiclostridium sp.]
MIKVGIFGGSFNPVHCGHINMAKGAADLLKLDKVLVMPTANSPHRETAATPFEDRMEMCRLAFADDKRFEISDFEKKLGGKNYTILTLRALKEVYPKDTMFYLLIGGDMLFYFKKWYRYESILKECTVVAAARENSEYIDLMEFANELGRVKVLNLPVVEASSTEVRERLSKGESTEGLIPQDVADYIKEKGLYL